MKKVENTLTFRIHFCCYGGEMKLDCDNGMVSMMVVEVVKQDKETIARTRKQTRTRRKLESSKVTGHEEV